MTQLRELGKGFTVLVFYRARRRVLNEKQNLHWKHMIA